MHIAARRILFFCFLLAFFIGAPLIVFYTAGYRYSPGAGIMRTGVISITTTPRNASVALDGESTNKTTPEVLKHVFPGTYQLSLSREGYHTWSGEIEVRTGQTTFLSSILLLQDADPTRILEEYLLEVSASPNSAYVAYLVQEGGWNEAWLLNVRNNNQQLLGRFTTATEEDVELSWSAGGDYLLAHGTNNGTVQVYDQNGAIKELPDPFLEDQTNVFWHPSSTQLLYAATEDELRLYDLEGQTLTIFDDPDVETVLIDASLITFHDNGSFIEVRQIIGDEYSVLALLPQASEYRVVDRDNSFFIIMDNRSTLYLIDIHANQPILLETTVTMYDWLSETDELVYTDGNEINVYNPHTHTFRFITRQGKEIRNLAWHPSGSIIIAQVENDLIAFEKEKNAKERVSTTLLSADVLEKFWMSANGKTLYFYGKIGTEQGLFTLPLTR